FGVRDRPGLRCLLAEHDMQERDDRDGDDRRHAAAGEEAQRWREGRKPPPEQMGDGVLGDVAEQNRGDGDAQLGGRELAVQVGERLLNGLGLAVAPAYHGLDAGAARRDERELRRHKKRVRRDEDEDGEEAQAERLYRGFGHGVRKNLAGGDSTSSATPNYVV